MILSHSSKSYLISGCLCIYSVLLIVLRVPELFIMPRFWAEEGTLYFSYAFKNAWWKTILYYPPNIGYYSLRHNISALLATLAPLEWAPLVTTSISACIIAGICLIVIFGTSIYWSTPAGKLIAITAIIALLHPWQWLTSTAIHFYLALFSFMIMLETASNTSRTAKWIFRICIMFGGLSSPTSFFLTPGFLWLAYKEKNREAKILSSILILTVASHVIPFLDTIGHSSTSRFQYMEFRSIGNWLYYQFSILVLDHSFFDEYGIGQKINQLFSSYFSSLSFAQHLPSFFLISAICICAAVLYCLSPAFKSNRHFPALIAFTSYSILSTFCSLNMSSGFRYVYVPSVILLIIFFYEFSKATLDITRKGLLFFLTIISLTTHLVNFSYNIYSEGFPLWLHQTYIWRTGMTEQLDIWPPGWSVLLKRSNAP